MIKNPLGRTLSTIYIISTLFSFRLASAADVLPQKSMDSKRLSECYATYFELSHASSLMAPSAKMKLYESEASTGLNSIHLLVDQASAANGDAFFKFAVSSRLKTRRQIYMTQPGSIKMESLADGLYKDAISCDSTRSG